MTYVDTTKCRKCTEPVSLSGSKRSGIRLLDNSVLTSGQTRGSLRMPYLSGIFTAGCLATQGRVRGRWGDTRQRFYRSNDPASVTL